MTQKDLDQKENALLSQAQTLGALGKYSEAIDILKIFWQQLGPNQRLKQIACLNEQSQCLWPIGQFAEAEICAKEALQLAEQNPPDIEGQSDALNNLGLISWYQGRLDKAEECHQRSLILRKKLGNSQKVATSLNNLGLAYRHQGVLDKAEECYQQCLAIDKEIGNPQDIAYSLNNLGNLYYEFGKLDQAETFLQQSLRLKKEIGNLQDITRSLNNLGKICWQRGKLSQAEKYFQQSIKLIEKDVNPLDISTSLNNLGVLYWQRGELDKAEDYCKQGLMLRKQTGNQRKIAESYHQLARIELIGSHLDGATEHVKRLAQLAETSKLPEITIRHLLITGMLKLKQFDFPPALTSGVEARTLAAQIPNFALEVEALQLLLQIHLKLQLLAPEDYTAQVETLLDELRTLSQRERLHGIHAETVLIQGFLKRALFDIKGATQQFEQAERVAREYGFLPLAQQARQELENLQAQITKFQQFHEESPQAYEEAQFQTIISYLENIRQMS